MPATTFAWRPVRCLATGRWGTARCRFLYLLTTGFLGRMVVARSHDARTVLVDAAPYRVSSLSETTLMLAATQRNRALLGGVTATDVRRYAETESNKSIQRFVDRANARYQTAGLRVEHDGHVIRCVIVDAGCWQDRVRRREQQLAGADPWAEATTDWLLRQGEHILWWHDLPSLQERFLGVKCRVAASAISGRDRLAAVPVVVGGDWEFNAWACPAGTVGDFIMLNPGFIHSYSYAAMFIDMMGEVEQAARSGGAEGLVTSSMIWMAATALGYEPFQWENLSLPPTECDRIWDSVQHPTDRLGSAIALIDAFAMLHECGHIACGHTDSLRRWSDEETLDTTGLLSRYAQMREFEFEADAFACNSLKTLGIDEKACVEPLLILFSMLRLCEDARDPASSLTATHPLAKDRLHRCIGVMGQDGDAISRLMTDIVSLVVKASRKRVEWQSSLGADGPRSEA